MARENQGLQIALIIFVMLFVVSSVMAFLFYRRYDEQFQAARAKEAEANKERSATSAKDGECKALKRLIGHPADKPMGDIETAFKADMENFGANNYPEDARFYSPMLTRLWEVKDDKEKQIKELEIRFQDQEKRYSNREQAKDKQIAQFNTAVETSGKEASKAIQEYSEQLKVVRDEQAKSQAAADKARADANAKAAKAEKAAEDRLKEMQELAARNESQAKELEKHNKPFMDRPHGEVRWVNQQSRTVWIDLGRADGLERQTAFSVYAGGTTDLGKAKRKGSIEVTSIRGDHMAEARIVDDSIADPIVIGDKIYTPTWSPGQRNRFALAGIMDLDGDGRNAVQTVRNLITMNNGVVDAYMNEAGELEGRMTVETRCLVLGKEPKKAEAMKVYGAMTSDAAKFGTRTISLTELQTQMGYKKQVAVERFGPPSVAPERPSAKPADTGTKKAGAKPAPKKRPVAAEKEPEPAIE
jgi:hypothetical protein